MFDFTSFLAFFLLLSNVNGLNRDHMESKEELALRIHGNHLFMEAAPGLSVRKDLVKGSRVDSNRVHEVMFATKQLNMEELREKLLDISDPLSINYGKHMTKDEVHSMTANPTANLKIKEYLTVKGAQILTETPSGEFISARGSIQVWEEIFKTEFFSFNHIRAENDVKEVLRAEQYSIPLVLKDYIDAVFGTVDMPNTMFRRGPVLTPVKKEKGSKQLRNGMHTKGIDQVSGTIEPPLLKSYYDIEGVGSTAATQGMFQSLDQHYSPDDLLTFQRRYGLDTTAQQLNVGNHDDSQRCRDRSDDCTEGNLDIQYLMAVSQGSPTTFWWVPEDVLFAEWLQDVANIDNPPLVFSISYGIAEEVLTSGEKDRFETTAIKLSARGVTLVAASGDDGAHESNARASKEGLDGCAYAPLFPASCPYVVAIGATQGPESGRTEVLASADIGGGITGGGGFSKYYQQENYQKKFITEYFNRVDGTNKEPEAGFKVTDDSLLFGGPDRVFAGYPALTLAGVAYEVIIGGNTFLLSGTSASAPVVAGMFSLINAQRLAIGKPSLGFVSPALYDGHKNFVKDITSGFNNCPAGGVDAQCCTQGFHATPGWDPPSGLGSPNFKAMSKYFMDLVTNPIITYNVLQTILNVNSTRAILPAFSTAFNNSISGILNINTTDVAIVNVSEETENDSSISYTVTIKNVTLPALEQKLLDNKGTLTTDLRAAGFGRAEAQNAVAGTFSPTPFPTQRAFTPAPSSSERTVKNSMFLFFSIGLLSPLLWY
mmetsp:Transcript_21927/g.21212  ORF Transcript_21927/g.21212 Transcript_21927/m.21212 type:complete len:770 (+) Transcript_21927:254-2563(+)